MKIAITLLIVFALASLFPCALFAKPILHFTFDSANGDVVADLSGGSHNGTLKGGATIVADTKKIGAGALKIDGGNQSMEVATFPALETYKDNTYAFWINFTAPASGGWDQILVHPAPDSDRSPGLWVTPEGLSIHYRYNPGNLGFWGITQTGDQDGKFFEQNTWYHVVGVTAGAELVAYVNGVKVASIAVPAVFAQGARAEMAGLYVGKSQSYSGPAAKFIIDDLAVYNRAISADEVMTLMSGLTSVDTVDKVSTTWGEMKHIK